MRFQPGPKPPADDEVLGACRPKRRRPLRSIGQIMMVVACSGFVLAMVKVRERQLRGPGPWRTPGATAAARLWRMTPRAGSNWAVPTQPGETVARPIDAMVKLAPGGIDDEMVRPAPAGIDDGMIFGPGRTRTRFPGTPAAGDSALPDQDLPSPSPAPLPWNP